MNTSTKILTASFPATTIESAWDRLVRAAQRIKVYTNDPKYSH